MLVFFKKRSTIEWLFMLMIPIGIYVALTNIGRGVDTVVYFVIMQIVVVAVFYNTKMRHSVLIIFFVLSPTVVLNVDLGNYIEAVLIFIVGSFAMYYIEETIIDVDIEMLQRYLVLNTVLLIVILQLFSGGEFDIASLYLRYFSSLNGAIGFIPLVVSMMVMKQQDFWGWKKFFKNKNAFFKGKRKGVKKSF